MEIYHPHNINLCLSDSTSNIFAAIVMLPPASVVNEAGQSFYGAKVPMSSLHPLLSPSDTGDSYFAHGRMRER